MKVLNKLLIRNQKLTNNTILLWPSIKKVLQSEIGQSNHSYLITLVDKKWADLVLKSGLVVAIRFMKRSRLHFTRALSGHPLLEPEGVKLNSNGLPRWMGLRSVEGLNPSEIRTILTLLTISRRFKLPISFDPHPITDKWGGALPDITGREFHHALRELNMKKWDWKWENFHFSTKSGPNGQALATSMYDVKCLPQQLKDDISLVGGAEITSALEDISKDNYNPVDAWHRVFPFTKDPPQQFRKLSHFPDKEGKTRTIAIFDYWSQTVLKPLHDHLNGVLKSIYNDCTFNQDHFLSCLPSSGPYFSFDLTNATDRMPLLLQKDVLSRIVGREKAEAWGRILCDWEFSTRGGPVKYNTGQPMGAYSSWPMMALTHHFIVRWAALKVGKPHFRKYALLGDDIVIADQSVADKYKEILSSLDMPISASKTHISNDTYEFAKRWIQKGIEVSPLSLSGIYETWSQYGLWSSFINTQQRHGWLNKKDEPENFLSDILIEKRKWRQITPILYKYRLFTSVLLFLRERTEVSADRVMHLLALPFPQDYDKISFIIDLISRILERQCEKERTTLDIDTSCVMSTYLKISREMFSALRILNLYPWLLKNVPILKVINDSHEKTSDCLLTLRDGTIQEKLDCIWSKDLVGSSIKTEIFSIRQSKSKVLSQSILVSQLKAEWQDYLKCENFL